jgi:hypothetical protein
MFPALLPSFTVGGEPNAEEFGMSESTERLVWQRSSYCGTSACIEVAQDGQAVLVRSSQDPQGSALILSHDTWRGFVASIKDGEYDCPPSVTVDPAVL